MLPLTSNKDKYSRLVAKVYVGETYVNLELIKQGMASCYQWFAPKETDLKNAELKAKKAKIGLWGKTILLHHGFIKGNIKDNPRTILNHRIFPDRSIISRENVHSQ